MNDIIPAGLSGDALWLPVVFMMLMGFAILAYVVLDGYDLGVGLLMARARDDADKDVMVSTIGPFWDANETWLVLGVGMLLIAFPLAHGVIMTALYLPVALMLLGLILRGVAFDFRVKARDKHKSLWNRLFFAGSLLAAVTQGVMLGRVVTGFEPGLVNDVFCLGIGACLASGYGLLGAGWLLIKTEGLLQARAVRWAQVCLVLTAVGVAAVSIATPIVSERIFSKWFSLPNIFFLMPIPLFTGALFLACWLFLRRLERDADEGNARGLERWCWAPFACTVGIFVLAFNGLAVSLFPYLVIDKMTIWDSAAASESLWFVLVGTAIVLPAILIYTVFVYRVFRGKTRALSYY